MDKETKDAIKATARAFATVIADIVDGVEKKTLSRNAVIEAMDQHFANFSMKGVDEHIHHADMQRFVFRHVALEMCGRNRDDGLAKVTFLPNSGDEDPSNE